MSAGNSRYGNKPMENGSEKSRSEKHRKLPSSQKYSGSRRGGTQKYSDPIFTQPYVPQANSTQSTTPKQPEIQSLFLTYRQEKKTIPALFTALSKSKAGQEN